MTQKDLAHILYINKNKPESSQDSKVLMDLCVFPYTIDYTKVPVKDGEESKLTIIRDLDRLDCDQ